jgi:uncharacterized membrane protein
MGSLALLGLLAIVAIILGPVAFFSGRETRWRGQELEKLVHSHRTNLQSALQIIERRLQQIETKPGFEAKLVSVSAPASAEIQPESPQRAGAVRPDGGARERSPAIGPKEALAAVPQTSFHSAADQTTPRPASELTAQLAGPATLVGRSEPEIPSPSANVAAGPAEAEAVPRFADLPSDTSGVSITNQGSDSQNAEREYLERQNLGGQSFEGPKVEGQKISAPAGRSLEEMIGTRWTVWVGGLALALGAILLVRYSIERGFFGPGARVTLGLALAALLVGAGEFLRRTDDQPVDAAGGAYIPGMLTAAGTIAAFGSIYAAHALYQFIGPSVAFVALGATGLACMAAAALHGPALAGLGLVGSFATPMLVTSAAPNAWPVVVYVGVVAAAAHGLSRWRGWPWLSLSAVTGAAAWAVVLLLEINLGFFTAAMTHIALQTALAAVFVAIERLGAVPDEEAKPDLVGLIVLGGAALLTIIALYAGSVTDKFGWAWLIGAAAVIAILAVAAWRVAAAAGAMVGASLVALAALSLWPPLPIGPADPLFLVTAGMISPDQPVLYAGAALWGCAGIAAAAALRLSRGPRLPLPAAACYAGAAALTPLGGLVIAYLRFASGAASPLFAIVAGVTALAFAAGARQFLKMLQASPAAPIRLGLGALASAAPSAVALALVFALDGGMLTVALALAAACTAFVSIRVDVPVLRWCVAAFGILIGARLAWDPRIVGVALSTTPIFNWLLFGYGVPAASFALASWIMRSRADDVPVRVADALAVLFSAFLVFFEIRHAMNGGDPYARSSGLIEQGLFAVSSFGFGIVLTWLDAARRNVVFRLASLAAGGIGMAVAALGLGVRWNPLLIGEPVEGGAILNGLLLGYLLPAILAGLLAVVARPLRPTWYWAGAGAISSILSLGYLLLETRLLFRGPLISFAEGASLAEIGSETACCLAVATGLSVALGKAGSPPLRFAFLAVAALAGVFCVAGLGLFYDPLFDPHAVTGSAVLNALIPGYLVPAMFAVVLTWFVRRLQPDHWKTAAGSGALALSLAYLVLQTRIFFHGPMIEAGLGAGVAELGVDASIFLAIAIAFTYATEAARQAELSLVAMVTTALALAVGVVGLGYYANPICTGDAIAGNGIFNSLLLGYGLPAFLAIMLAPLARRLGAALAPVPFDVPASVAAIAWLFAFVTLETRWAFQGENLWYLRPTGEGEWYAYSAVWLALGILLLAYGLWRRADPPRLASSAFVTASVAKVFLFDLSGLEGILRAASFIGLGLCLIGIGLTYQKLVFTQQRARPTNVPA